MGQEIKITRKQAKPVLKVSFPEYNGRKVKVSFTDKVYVYDLNWSGGTRNEYKILSVNGIDSVPSPAPWDNPFEGTTISMTSDMMVVKHAYFCGHDLGITIYAHPSYAPKWLTD